MNYKKSFLYIDMDSFFASVEQRDNPEWKGKPVIVGGLPNEPRSVVSTASYEARKYGVHSAMPISKAVKLCPNGIYTHGNHKHYSEISLQIMQILSKYSPDLHQISIDEASLEMTGTELLFGPPDEVALKIQKEIFEKTQLTVSIGLASSSYLAKLASEVNKPNGFYAIPEGKEIDFMLSLPLKKVWGIGKKTLERLNRNGFFTTKDIYLRSKESLISLFGFSTGTFLYNSVRGLETETKSTGSHSISNEITFPEDISNIYTAETVLMELSYSIMFRLLKAKSFSKTIFIKIRYDDFSTFTSQETFSDYITSCDDLFEKLKSLFERKYEPGRALRLLGAGLENIEDENSAKQEVLFDFGEKKKQAVENAILKLSSKHPEIKIQKARTLNNKIKLLIFAFLSVFTFCKKDLTAEEYIFKNDSKSAGSINSPDILLPIPDESPSSLFNFNINDNEILFFLNGWWNGEMEGSFNATNTKEEGLTFSSPDFIFKQQVDFSMNFMLNKQWYFTTNFADEFLKNTIAAGFYGKDENPLKEVKISNRNIIFPDTYSISLFNRNIGGGDNQAPGIAAHFASPFEKKWTADFVLRYDTTEQHDATFYGKNSVSETVISLSDYMKGQFFSLPPSLLSDIKDVYVENSNGNYTDEKNRKLRKLSSDEYIISLSEKMLVISKDAGISKKNKKRPAILITFNSFADETSLKSELGDFEDDSEGEKITFLKEIQNYFGKDIKLKKYTNSIFTKINKVQALILQEAQGFSPFLHSAWYDLGLSSSSKVKIADIHSENQSKDFLIETIDEFENFISSSFVNEKHTFAKIYTEETEKSIFNVQERFPLAKKIPKAYLNSSYDSDLNIIVQKYTPLSSFNIGTNAESGSVKVYKNSILLTGTQYNSESGEVTLSSSVSDSDKIYITWNETSSENETGAIAAEGAFKYFFTKNLFSDLAVATNWTINPSVKYSEYSRAAGGYASIALGTEYKTDNLNFLNATALTYEKTDVTGKYRIESFENERSETYYLSKSSGYDLSENQIPVLKIQDTTSEKILELDEEKNCTVKSSCKNAERDTKISGYKIPLEWENLKEENAWAAINIKLSSATNLNSSSIFRIALECSENIPETLDFYIQLGILANDENETIEEENIPTWHLSELKSGWQQIELYLSESDRSRLCLYNDARLIIVKNDANDSDFVNGSIYAGPYEIIPNGISSYASEKTNIKTEQKKENDVPFKDKFSTDDNFVQKISWDFASSITEDEKNIIIGKFLNETDISKYRFLKFYFKNSNFSSFNLILDKDSSSLSEDGTKAVELKLNETSLSYFNKPSDSTNTENDWHCAEIDLVKNTFLIDGNELPKDSYSLFINKNKMPLRFKIEFTPNESNDDFYIDELFMEDSSGNFNLQNISKIELKKEGDILNAGAFPLLKDAYFLSQTEYSKNIPEDDEKSTEDVISSLFNASVTVATIKLSSDVSLSSETNNALSSLSNTVKTTTPLLKILNIEDSFIFIKDDSSVEKNTTAELNFFNINIPFSIKTKAQSEKNRWNYKTNLDSDFIFKIEKETWNIFLKTNICANQKTKSNEEELKELSENSWTKNYTDSFLFSFDNGSENALKRNLKLEISTGFMIPFFYLSPEINFTKEEKYSNTSSAKYNSVQNLQFIFPLKIKDVNVSVKYIKEMASAKTAVSGGTYNDDAEELINSFTEDSWFYKTAPFYDFFSKDFSEEILSEITKNSLEKINYSGKYVLSVKRPIFMSIKDFFIPVSFELSGEREISVATDFSGNYIFKSSILNTPMNIFGREGIKPLFKWYKTDEYVLSLNGTLKIPETSFSDSIWNINFYIQKNYWINENDTLRNAVDFTFEEDSEWEVSLSSQYKRLIKKSKKKSSNKKFFRTDNLDFSLNYNAEDEYSEQKYEYSHKLSAELFKHFTLDCALNFYLNIKKDITSLTASGTIGGNLTF